MLIHCHPACYYRQYIFRIPEFQDIKEIIIYPSRRRKKPMKRNYSIKKEDM
jgi:hypothetical protein